MISEVPIISIKSLWNEGLDRHQTVQQIHTAMQNIGFFYIVDHGIEEDLVQQIFHFSKIFFSLPQEEKEQINMKKVGKQWRGYFPVGGELTSGYPDRKEGIYLGLEHSEDNPGVKNGWPTFGQNQWLDNQQLNGFKETYQEYIEKLTKLAHLLMQAISEALQLPLNYFEERFTKDPTILFRIFNYPKHIWSEDEWGVREHTDYGFLTILKQDNSGGLQVKTRDHRWVDAPPVENSFVINIGDMLELWTHGLYRATPHRVRNKAPNDRVSLPFFFDPSLQNLVQQRKQLEAELQNLQAEISQLDKINNKPLVDDEGFPRADLQWSELTQLRNLKRAFNEKNNDHKDLMKQIEQKLYQFHQEIQNDPNVINEMNNYKSTYVPQPKIENKLIQQINKVKIEEEVDLLAHITEVTQGSPSSLAGLQLYDFIISFGDKNKNNTQSLEDLANYIRSNVDQDIPLKVLRKLTNQQSPNLKDDSYLITDLVLRPQKWAGQGILGCRFKLV